MVFACFRLDNACMVELEHDRLLIPVGQCITTGFDYVVKQTAYRHRAINNFVIDLLCEEGRQFRYNGNLSAVD